MADGIWRIGVELPQNPLRELNSYLIKGKENERDLLIDTGFRREECREALFAGLRALGSSPDRLDILLTHLHSDHTGLARGGGRGGQLHLYQRNRSGNLKGRFYTRASASCQRAIPCRGISRG
ncbi:MAG: MBL fold metallo-hydrolase [Clostridium fessum]